MSRLRTALAASTLGIDTKSIRWMMDRGAAKNQFTDSLNRTRGKNPWFKFLSIDREPGFPLTEPHLAV